jgi:hypothetical protein
MPAFADDEIRIVVDNLDPDFLERRTPVIEVALQSNALDR